MKNNKQRKTRQICLILCLLIGISIVGFAQNKTNVLLSNQKTIMICYDNIKSEWVISPDVKPDIFNIYDLVDKKKKVKFVSDIDSVEFNVKVNHSIDFAVLYKGDTAYTRIDFHNQLPNSISMTDKLLALSMFWSEVRYNFAFYDQLTFDWDSLYKAYISLVEATTTDLDYSELMQQFSGSLQDAHTGIYFRNTSFPYKDYFPMSVQYFEDTLRIISIEESLKDIYPLGSKIIKINGMSADEYMDKYVNPYVASKFKPTQQHLAASALLSAKKLDHKITLTYTTPQDETKTNTPVRNGEKNRDKPSVGKEYNYDRASISISWLENQRKIAHLRLNSFNDLRNSIEEYFEKNKDTLYHADGIIIDLRQNGGGSTTVAEYFLKHIIKDSFFLRFGAEARINNSAKKSSGNYIAENEDFLKMRAFTVYESDTIFIEDSIKRFDCPIVVLISGGTVSAAEDFLIMLYERPDRPLFIGQPSFGSTGGPLVLWDWPIEGGFARICSRRMLYPYSKKPFNEGITPDIWVKYTFEEYMDNVDKDIKVAVKELEKQIQARKNE